MYDAVDKYIPGTLCTINKSGDIYMYYEARPFFDVPCIVIKRTKAGLIMVALADDVKHTYSFPQCNVDLIQTIPQNELL